LTLWPAAPGPGSVGAVPWVRPEEVRCLDGEGQKTVKTATLSTFLKFNDVTQNNVSVWSTLQITFIIIIVKYEHLRFEFC